MKHSRFGDMGYWYEGRDIRHDRIHARCVAKGGSKFMFKSPGVLSHVYNWYQDLSKQTGLVLLLLLSSGQGMLQ